MPKVTSLISFGEFVEELQEEFAEKSTCLNIVEFIERYLPRDVLGIELSKAQWTVLKSFYGEKLTEEEISILEYWKISGRTTWSDERKHRALIVESGRRSGKSFVASIIAVYEFYKLTRLSKPQLHYGVAINTPIVIQVMATSAGQGRKTIFGQIKGLITNCEYFRKLIDAKKVEVLNEQIKYDSKLCYVYIGNSNSAGQVGQAIICLVMDEVARFDDDGTSNEEGSTALDIWSNVGISGASFREDAIRVAISSAWCENDAIYTLYNKCKNNKEWLGFTLMSGQMNPLMGDDNPVVIDEFINNPGKAALEFHGIRSANSNLFFTTDMVLNCITGKQCIEYEKVKENSLVKLILKYVERLPKEVYVHIDPAVVTDSYGMAIGHRENNCVIIDSLLAWEPEPGFYVSLVDVQEALKFIHNRSRIKLLSCDQHQGVETLQRMQMLGVPTKGMWYSNRIQVDMYEITKRLIVEKRLILPDYQQIKTKLIKEAVSIRCVNGLKITHVGNTGGKDLWDCICAICFNAGSDLISNSITSVPKLSTSLQRPLLNNDDVMPDIRTSFRLNYYKERRSLYE